jgi:hypothetical protein
LVRAEAESGLAAKPKTAATLHELVRMRETDGRVGKRDFSTPLVFTKRKLEGQT